MKPMYFPKLVDNHTTPKPAPGEWAPQGNIRLLETIPEDLDIRGGEMKGGIINAIPTVYARPWLFAQALFAGPQNPLHRQFKAEWRGLLGLFCFKDVLGIKLTTTPYSILKPERARKEDKVLVGLLDALLPSEDWRQMWLIEVDGHLLGATTPVSIFFTPAEYTCPPSVAWRREDNGLYVLSDPTEYFIANKGHEELTQLHFGLAEVKEHVKTDVKDTYVRGKLNDLLDEWIDELKKLPVVRPDATFLLNLQSIINPAPYAAFTRPLQKGDERRSDIFLEPTKTDAERPLVLCEDTLKKGVRVYDAFFGDAIPLPDDPQGKKLKTKTGESIEYPWIRPELCFFTEYLLEISLSENTLNSNFIKEPTYTLPLTDEFFKYFGGEDVVNNLQMQRREDGSVQVFLTLELSGMQTTTVGKVYMKEKIKKLISTPVLEVWPNFQAKDWKLYYCYFSGYEQAGLFRDYGFEPVIEPGPHVQHIKEADRAVWKLERFPEAIHCKFEDKSAGIILIKPPETVTDAGIHWIVGVDFGTSNTGVFYYQQGQAEASKLSFQDRCVPILGKPENPNRRLDLYKRFFPTKTEMIKEIIPDFPTLFMLLRESPASSREAVLNGIAYFQIALKEWEIKLLKSNLKWADNKQDQQLISVFLEHLLIMIAAEAKAAGVSSLELRWSYPSAFSEPRRRNFSTFWRARVKSLDVAQSVGIKPEEGVTESVAACRYFAQELGATIAADEPTVFIDIGGGTTDIAVWLENQLVLQTSIKLAGNDVVVEYARKSPGFMPMLLRELNLEGDDPTAILTHFNKQHSAVLNSVLQSEARHQTLKELLPVLGVEDEFKKIRTVIFIFLSGLLYYVGMLVRSAWNERKKDALTRVAIYFAGKAARLTDWPADFNDYQDYLEAMVRRGYGDNGIRVALHQAERPKEEVCRGLVYDYKIEKQIPDPLVIAGEDNYALNGRSLQWNGALTHSDFEHLQPSGTLFPKIHHFVEGLQNYLSKLSLNPVAIPDDLRAQMMQKIYNIRQGGEEAIIQPLFMLELKILLDHCIQQSVKGK